MELINESNNYIKNISTSDKKKIKLKPINIKMKKSQSQKKIFYKKNEITKRIKSSFNNKKHEDNKNQIDKKLFNNANDYQFLYKDIRNTRFDVLWVKYLRNFKYSPGPIQQYGGFAPSFYEEDLESFKKRFKFRKVILKKSKELNDEQGLWKNLSMSNEEINKRYNEFLPHINNNSVDNSIPGNVKNKYLHPFIYKFRKVTMADGKTVNQRYIKYDDKKTLKFPSLIFSANKYNDRCNIKNYNNVKDYLNIDHASDFVKWQSKLRSYEKP